MDIDVSGDLKGWFYERLVGAMARRSIDVSDITQHYLVELLSSFALDPKRANLDEPLALQLAAASECEGHERITRLRAMGDSALYISGFFGDHLNHRGVTPSYVRAMGERAYSSAGALATYSTREGVRRQAYAELAERFEPLVGVFDELKESTVLQTPQDIVRLYDRWKRTKSPTLARRLQEEGVFPQDANDDRVLH